ncbi:MAG: sigma-70 family RNA polymerase sigma factor [Oscillospiraceae bacterium]|jgi:RNA polymerase sigma-70 factor (ECF subfamily)|nr:sigma-70 family RNA polymerase sigma factor [Oscillospiraceae bacterium]
MLTYYLSIIDDPQQKSEFEKLYSAHRTAALRAAMIVTGGNTAIAEDALHDTFMKIIDGWEKFFRRPCNNWRSLIVIMVKNRAIDILRREKKLISFDENIADIDSESEDLAAVLQNQERFDFLVDCVAEIPEYYRIPLELRCYHEMSNTEIAEVLGVEYSNVTLRISRAKAKLRKIIEGGSK